MKSFIISLILLCSTISVAAQNLIIPEHGMASIRMIVNDDYLLPPYLRLGSDDKLELSFDELSHEYHRYTYRITHHQADGSKSDLQESEFLRGLNDLVIENEQQSKNTTVPYTHYSLTIPNDRQQLLVSGHYRISIYNEQSSEPVIVRDFAVTEDKVKISATLSGNTDIDSNQSHQQLSFSVQHKGYTIQNVPRDVKFVVLQNNAEWNKVCSWDKNGRTIIQPSLISQDEIRYEHCRNLIFEAGNEFRRFEMTDQRSSGIHVHGLEFIDPFWHVTLDNDQTTTPSYIYQNEINGRYLPRYTKAEDSNIEADYYIVHFSLDAELTTEGLQYVLEGYLTNHKLLPLTYDKESHQYHISMLLKQGAYNYRYLLHNTKTGASTISNTDGSFYQTNNEYLLYIYHRPFGERYDHLIGVTQISN